MESDGNNADSNHVVQDVEILSSAVTFKRRLSQGSEIILLVEAGAGSR